jgi:hypothetical protein
MWINRFWIVLIVFLFPVIHTLAAPAFFTIDWKENKAWFQTPLGDPFLSMGVNAIADQSYRAPNDDYYNPVKNQYQGDIAAWDKVVLQRLKAWKFNSLGAWCDDSLLSQKVPYTFMTYIARGSDWDRVLDNVFSPDFETQVRQKAVTFARFKNDPYLIGYFLDNELPWWGQTGWRAEGQKTLLEKYAGSFLDESAQAALVGFFKDRYQNNIQAFNDAWDTSYASFESLGDPLTIQVKTRQQKSDANAWAGVVADRYFSVTTRALRTVDPNHLILGVRFAGETPWEVVEACGKYCDVVSVNQYQKSGHIDKTLLDDFYVKSGKPILLSEYSFSALQNQSGDPDTHGADVTVSTQKERAQLIDSFVKEALSLPYLVGLHWFEWADESPRGRFDGEDQNYGLVDLKDAPYALVTQEHAKLNGLASGLHAQSAAPLPDQFVSRDTDADYRRSALGAVISNNRSFLKMDASTTVYPWGDKATGGAVSFSTASGALEIQFQSGGGWGCGVSCPSNIPPWVASGVVDLTGYNQIQFDAFAPPGTRFLVYLSESGNADPSAKVFSGLNGADGESYSFPSLEGSGHWQNYRIHLEDLEKRTEWGNQRGNNILDLQAISDLDFYIPGGQGDGKIILKNIQFQK